MQILKIDKFGNYLVADPLKKFLNLKELPPPHRNNQIRYTPGASC